MPRALKAAPLFCLALLAGCGVPGDPLPPLLELPQPVRDLRGSQVGARVLLNWTPPAETTEGTLLREPARMRFYSAYLPAGTPMSDPSTQLQLLSGGVVQEGPASVSVDLRADQVGLEVYFAAKAANGRGKDAGFSNIVSFPVSNVPAPPLLRAVLSETAVKLTWEPSPRSAFGTEAAPVSGYHIVRGEEGADRAFLTVGEVGGAASSFDDTSFQFGHTYLYAVEAVVMNGDSRARSEMSNTVRVDAVDTFPPAPPQNLTAIGIPGAAELAWSPNSEADLAGYNVYRAGPSGSGSFDKVNSELLTVPLFRDALGVEGPRSGVFRYRVTAVDRSGNESAPSAESAATLP